MTAPSPPVLPVSLAANPRLSSWLKFSAGGRVILSPGKVEIGQGIVTALAQIAADELDVDISRVQMIRASTALSPNEGVTSGSLSIQQSGRAVRHACAEVRQIFLERAADRLGVDIAALNIRDGEIGGPGNARTSYWELAGEVSLDREASPGAAVKPAARRALAGQAVQRLDIPDKVFAHARFIQDVTLAGMLHGRVLRSESSGARIASLSETAARAIQGCVAVTRDGSFAGVVCESEHSAELALTALRKGTTWSGGEVLPDEDDLASFLKSQPVESHLIDRRSAATTTSTQVPTMTRRYSRPYLAHASAAPSCAIARWEGDHVHVWTHSQAIYLLRADIARTLDIPAEHVTVEHLEGAGCYGHNAADDVALDAVLLARAARGRAVRVMWSRADEMMHAPFGAAMLVEITAAVDDHNNITDWRHSIWGNGHTTRPNGKEPPKLLAASAIRNAPLRVADNQAQANGGGADRNAIPLYDFPSWQVEYHRLLTMPIRTSALRSLGGQCNVFAIESLIDEIAGRRGEDPVAFRLSLLRDERARDVIKLAAKRANWKSEKRPGIGYGFGFARYKNTGAYCAAVAEIEAAEDIRVTKLTLAADVGEIINPDGVLNQLEGGAIQATSWALKERVRFDRQRITSTSWSEYPILRFSEVPDIEVALLPRPDMDPLGAGEAALGPTTAAIGNAVCDALGVRIFDLPITRARVIGAVEAAPNA